jgi:hypothetical protein
MNAEQRREAIKDFEKVIDAMKKENARIAKDRVRVVAGEVKFNKACPYTSITWIDARIESNNKEIAKFKKIIEKMEKEG